MVRTMLGARIRAQTSYRASFVGDLAAQGLLAVVEFIEIYVLLHHAPVFGGMDLRQAAVVYGLAQVSFGLADMIFGQLDSMDVQIRSGKLEVLLIRPAPLLLQLITQDVQLRRLGRALFGLIVVILVLVTAPIEWGPANIAIAVISPIAGTLVFGALFLLSDSLLFWVIDGAQAGNVITYGGHYVSSVPGSALFTPVRRFFTFVVPATLIAYVPAAVMTGAALPTDIRPWLVWCGLPAALITWSLALLAWRAGIRHYTGAGG